MSKYHYIILRASKPELLQEVAQFLEAAGHDGDEVPQVLTFENDVFIRDVPNYGTDICIAGPGDNLDAVEARPVNFFELKWNGGCPFCGDVGSIEDGHPYEEGTCSNCGARWNIDGGNDYAPTKSALECANHKE